MIYMHSGEQKRQNRPENQMARRTKWPEEPSCAWRTEIFFRQPVQEYLCYLKPMSYYIFMGKQSYKRFLLNVLKPNYSGLA